MSGCAAIAKNIHCASCFLSLPVIESIIQVPRESLAGLAIEERDKGVRVDSIKNSKKYFLIIAPYLVYLLKSNSSFDGRNYITHAPKDQLMSRSQAPAW